MSVDQSSRGKMMPERVAGNRLDSWKAIAEYLSRDVRSVQRWERSLGLPVHRVSGEKGGVVFAFTGELERWLQSRPRNGNSNSSSNSNNGPYPLNDPPTEAETTPASHDLTANLAPAKRDRHWTKYAVAIAALLLIAAGSSYVMRRPLRRWLFPREHSSRAAKPAPGRVMLAVLPFVNLSGNSSQDYFADGLTEEMITDLGCLNPRALGVIARTSAMKYKNTNEDIAQIGRELGVSYILEGSVRREGDQVRVSAQLIQVSDQTHLWAQSYELRVKDILDVQRDVAATIADKIQINLKGQRPQLAHVQLTNPEAYDDYLHGRYLLSQRNQESFIAAIKFFKQAVAEDPSFALGYAGLADSYVLLTLVSGPHLEPNAKAAALRAIALNDNLAEAHTSLAAVDVLEWNWRAAEKEFRRALAINPNYALAHHWYGNLYLSPMGRHEEAIAELKEAQTLDPLSLIINTDLGYAYFFAGEYDAAIAQYRKVLAVDPSFVSAHWVLAQYYDQRGMYDSWAQEAAEVCVLDGNTALAQQIKATYASGGRKKLLEFMANRGQGVKFTLVESAGAAAELGRKEEALQDLERACRQRNFELLRLKADPVWNSLRSEPRFQKVERDMGSE
ncbi:MAG: tetratricopeptide repeat protein [Terriglobales bacterium]